MRVLLVPEITPGRGSGHLRRAIRLASELPGARILVPPGSVTGDLLEAPGVRDRVIESPTGPWDRVVDTKPGTWDRVVVDCYSVDENRITALKRLGLTIGIDPGGPGRAFCDYVIDTFPRLDRSPANLSEPEFLDLPQPGPPPGERVGILVSFGGEDPARLSEACARELAKIGERVTVVRPTMRTPGTIEPAVEVVDPQPTLAPLLQQARVVVTSFGMTAFEARAAGARVVTVAPTRYHDRLARKAGFDRAGVRRVDRRSLLTLVRRPDDGSRADGSPDFAGSGPTAGEGGTPALARLVRELPEPVTHGCPAHPGRYGRALWRSREKSYFECPDCSLRYLERFAADEQAYGEAYFMEEYERQYGRTYLDDFDHIRTMGARRVKTAIDVAPRRPGSVLDIGCAYGPFLAAASTENMEGFGVDVAESAAAYVRERLGLPAVCADILDLDARTTFGREQFDLVTLWYVVEHFARLDELLKRLARLVRPGGVLAMSTPHGAGVSAIRNPDEFYAASPRDHYTIWDRNSARRVLAEYGFRVRRFVVTGHHPERYPGVRAGWLPRGLAAAHSRLAGRGDTFEIYAIREER